MSASFKSATSARQPLTPLAQITVAALGVEGLAYLLLLLAIHTFVLALLIVGLAIILVAGLTALLLAYRPRWGGILGALTGLGTIIGGLVSQSYFPYHLTHPAEGAPFLVALLGVVCAIIALGAGIGVVTLNAQPTPRWLPLPFAGLGGFAVGVLVVTLLIQGAPSAANTTPSTINGEPAVHMGVDSFTQSSVTIPRGSKLLLVDDGAFTHILRNGEWVGSSPHPATEAGAPVVNNVRVNNDTVEIGPFNTPGVYHIYCIIHPGMTLTVHVQ